MKKMVFLHI